MTLCFTEGQASLKTTGLVFPFAVAMSIEVCYLARIKVSAETIGAFVALVAVDTMVEDFVPNRGRASSNLVCDCRYVEPARNKELNSVPDVNSHMFHGCILSFFKPTPISTRLSDIG